VPPSESLSLIISILTLNDIYFLSDGFRQCSHCFFMKGDNDA